MLPAEIYAHVLPAVRLIIEDKGLSPDTRDLDAHVHGALWAYVTHAVRELHPSMPSAADEPPKRDGREKTWQYIVRFYMSGKVIGETDTETMRGTGELPGLVARYTREMHDGVVPSLNIEEAVKAKLPQLRNNLGRYGKGKLQIDYSIRAENSRLERSGVVGEYLCVCEIEVSKPA